MEYDYYTIEYIENGQKQRKVLYSDRSLTAFIYRLRLLNINKFKIVANNERENKMCVYENTSKQKRHL